MSLVTILALSAGLVPSSPALPSLAEVDLDARLMGLEDVEPPEAVRLATESEGVPELLEEMLRVCKRESSCGRWGTVGFGIHAGDASAGRKTYLAAVRKGWLHPDECPEHRADEGWARFSTVGVLGVRAAWVLHLLEPEFGRCVSPDVLLHPGPAALGGVRWAQRCRVIVEYQDRKGRQRRRQVPRCGCAERTRMWAGPRRFDDWTHRHRRQSLTRQCGEQPALTTWQVIADVPQDVGALVAWTFAWFDELPIAS